MSVGDAIIEMVDQWEAALDRATYNGFRILSNGVLVRKLPYQREVPSGRIVIPEEYEENYARNSFNERIAQGEVLAVGDGHLIKKGPRAGERIPLIPQPGEVILFCPCEPNDEVTVNGEKLWVVHENHVLGVVER